MVNDSRLSLFVVHCQFKHERQVWRWVNLRRATSVGLRPPKSADAAFDILTEIRGGSRNFERNAMDADGNDVGTQYHFEAKAIRPHLVRALNVPKPNVTKAVRYLIEHGLLEITKHEGKERATTSDAPLHRFAAEIAYRCSILEAGGDAVAALVEQRGWAAVCEGVDEALRLMAPRNATDAKYVLMAVETYLERKQQKTTTRHLDMYQAWRDAMKKVTTGAKVTSERKQFNANVKHMRDTIDPTGQYRELADLRIEAGFHLFAGAALHGRLHLRGRPAWSIFMGRWQKYVKAHVISFDKDDDGTWIGRQPDFYAFELKEARKAKAADYAPGAPHSDDTWI